MSKYAILHPTTLLGKELKETLERRPGWQEIRLLSTQDDEIGTLTEVAGAAAVVQRYDPDDLHGLTAVFLSGPAAQNRPILAELPPGVTGILLSPDSTLDDGRPVVAGVNLEAVGSGGTVLSPHPAVVLLAHLLHPLAGLEPQRAVATVLQPASIEGDAGIEELVGQTRNIFTMTGRKASPVFGAQLAFNLMPAPLSVEPLTAQLGAVLGRPSPAVLQVIQAGVFHSLSVSVHLHFGGETAPSPQAIRQALAASPYLEVADTPKHLGPVDAAGSDKVIFGTVRKATDGGFWLWAVMDNLTRGGALNAIEVAEAV
jgi:aspartate-semialdehyde dehydrogenase